MRKGAQKSRAVGHLASAVIWGTIIGSLTIAVASPANAAPPTVSLVSPADGATVGSPAQLSVSVSDPDGDASTVTFEGRRKGLTLPGPNDNDPFSLVVLPDTQNYTYNNRQGTMNQQAQWVVANSAPLNIAFTVQVGDLVSEYDNLGQWALTSAALKIMDDAGKPNSVTVGNHDFNNANGDLTQFNQYFPVSRYAQASWNTATTKYGGYLGQNQFGTDPINRGNADNYALFTAGGVDFLVLNLEWEAPGYALDWADRVMDAYSDRTVIMVTHSFLTVSGSRWTGTQRPGGTSQASLWTDFVATHCQIRIVIAGHEHNGDEGEANRTDNNNCGQPVQQLMTDYQDRANGGDGWLRYYTFDPAANTMAATTYSPKLNQYETDADSSFVLPFDLTPRMVAPFEPIGTAPVTGGTASMSWGGLAADTAYEWRAVVSAGADTVTSPTYSLQTAPPVPTLSDTFTRTTTSGWGTADTGQAWVPTSSASNFTVDGANARITTAPGQGRTVNALVFRSTDLSVTTDVSTSVAPGGSGAYVSLLGRTTGSSDYRATLQLSSTTTAVTLRRLVNGTETILGTQRIGNGVAAGTAVHVRYELTGTSPTTLRTKVWTGATEPTAWSLTTTDSTAALQAAGGVGVYSYLSGSAGATLSTIFPSYTAVGGVGTPPVNQLPNALIGTPTVSARTVAISGAGSSDPDGTVTGWSWAWGDGTPATTGSTANHTYTADGTYTITLTVTDNQGATATATRSVTVAAPVNQAPTAVIAAPTITGRAVGVNGTGSTDPDGTVTGWSWAWGDGTPATTGSTANHTYTADGTYTITLTVTDNQGATATATRSVTVAAPVNQAPTAVIAAPTITGRAVGVNGTGSTDPDGTVTGWSWAWGDGTPATTGSTANHTYTADGTYTITLTVTDNQGATATATRSVTVAAPVNQAPTAVIAAPTITGRAVGVNGTGSTDPDGTVTGWSWAWGDGTPATTGSTANHTYTADGAYTITLTVTDNQGATATTTRTVTVAAPVNQAPTAVIAAPTITGRAVGVNGTGSTDPDGTVTGWSWAWGDGTPATTGSTANHTYTADGTYTITLTVTDNQGATATATRTVTVAAAPAALLADDFGRTVSNAWGSADVGGAWTATGTSTRFAVGNGVGQLRLTTPGASAQVDAIAAKATASEVRLNVSWDRTSAAGSLYTVISPRAVSASADYRLKIYISGTVPYLDLIRRTGGTETLISRTALSIRMTTAGDWYSVAVRTTTTNGVTTLSAKLWPKGTTEPAAWQATVTDSTAGLQTTGWMMLWTYMSSSATAPVTTSFDDIRFTSVP